MFWRVGLLLFGGLLLLQISSAVPITKSARIQVEEAYHSVPFTNATKAKEFYDESIQNLTTILNATVNNAAAVLKEVIKDSADPTNQTESLHEHIDKFKVFVESVNKLPKKSPTAQYNDIFALLQNVMDFHGKYEDYQYNNASAEVKQIEHLMDDNGWGIVILQQVIDLVETMKYNSDYIKNYINSLDPEQKEHESKLVQWIDENNEDFINTRFLTKPKQK